MQPHQLQDALSVTFKVRSWPLYCPLFAAHSGYHLQSQRLLSVICVHSHLHFCMLHCKKRP